MIKRVDRKSLVVGSFCVLKENMVSRSTLPELYGQLSAKVGTGGSFSLLPVRIWTRTHPAFLKRYKQRGGSVTGEGLSAQYETEIGVEVLSKTLQHIRHHLEEEIEAEKLLLGTSSTVRDLEFAYSELGKFVS